MKQTIFILLLAIAACGSLAAQSLVSVSPKQCVWRAGDNPAWAAPGLDETGWQPSSQWKLPLEEPHLWARCHADLGALRGTAHPAIQISLDGAYQLFVNGALVGSAGNICTGFYSMNTIRQYSLPPVALESQTGTIALRITSRSSIWTASPLEVYSGNAEVLAGRRAGFVLAHSLSVLRVALWYPLIGVVGLMLLGLFYYDRAHPELLYLSMICVIKATYGTFAYCSAALMDFPWALSITTQQLGSVLEPVVFVLFFFAIARRPVPRMFLLAAAVVATRQGLYTSTLLLPVDQSLWLQGKVLDLGATGVLVTIAWLAISASPFIAFRPYSQISPRMRPMAALCMLYGAFYFVLCVVGFTGDPRMGLPDLFTAWRRTLLETLAFVTGCVVVGLLALLFRDQRLATEERAMLAGEMQAASEIQHMLAPAKIENAPGLRAEVAFHPVQEVGGDFYQIIRRGDDAALILIGDVSGKGLRAAMTGTLAVGALRALAAQGMGPAALFAALNRQVVDLGQEGFITCLCLLIASSGEVAACNAGHLPPYLNGKETAFESGLPIGVTAEAEYTERQFTLTPGDRLTLLSDGVIEAKGAGGELFGFERTAAISTRPAEEVAKAAQAFGQEDDITVLTLTFAPVGVAHV
jgi:phosphoserine phosphatase RsbU/P